MLRTIFYEAFTLLPTVQKLNSLKSICSRSPKPNRIIAERKSCYKTLSPYDLFILERVLCHSRLRPWFLFFSPCLSTTNLCLFLIYHYHVIKCDHIRTTQSIYTKVYVDVTLSVPYSSEPHLICTAVTNAVGTITLICGRMAWNRKFSFRIIGLTVHQHFGVNATPSEVLWEQWVCHIWIYYCGKSCVVQSLCDGFSNSWMTRHS